MTMTEAKGWIECDLSDLIVLIESGQRPYGGATEETGEIPSLGGENIRQDGGLNLSAIKKVPIDFFRSMTKGVLQNEDVLINKDGANTGKVGLYEGQFPVATINEHLFLLRGAPGKLTQRYLYRILSSESGQRTVHAKISGSAQPGLKSDFIRHFPVRIPGSTTEQSRIDAVLDTVDEAIVKTEAFIAKLKQMRAGLLHDLLTRGLDEHGQLRDPFAHPEQFKDSPLGRIPKEWEVYLMGAACSLIKDGTHLPPPRVEEGPLLLGVQNIIDDCLKRTDSDTRVSWDFFNEMHRNWQITSGDVMLAIVGATIGKVTRVPDDFEPFTVQRSVAILRGVENVLINDFLEVFLRGHYFQTLIKNFSNQTAQPGLYLEQIAALQLPLPVVAEQKLIAERVMALEKHVWSERACLEKLKSLKSGLMSDLLSGRVRVPETITEVIP